ncbi:hypothetical protein LZC95_34975 [Pendulispora brunnea]|uniref:Galactose oxidase n=1 Tax=Pendulispora brunnea TaxID=2905690 RepID=A0ABZ2JYU5_9BACT
MGGAVRCLRLSCLAIALASAMAACGDSNSAPPASRNAWTSARSLPIERFEAYAAAFEGRIYFIGGITGLFGDIGTARPSRRVDVYDPATDAWTPGPDLPEDAPKHHLAVAMMADGIYVVGGFDGILGQLPGEPFRPVAKAYALRQGAWVRLADPPLARGAATAQALDGRIYVAGGAPTEGQPPYDRLDVYDPSADTWQTLANMPTAREHLASCALDGKFLVIGGWIGPEEHASTRAEEYDPRTNAWRALADLPTARGGLAAVSDGNLCHVIGGEDWFMPFPGTFSTHEAYDPSANAWRTLAPMPTARHGFGLARLAGSLFAVGGGPSMGNSYTNVTEVYLP